MKSLIPIFILSILVSCVGGLRSATLTLSEPDDSSVVRALGENHRLSINENRILIYNGDEKFFVPEGKQVVFQIVEGEEPIFTLKDK